MSAVTYGPEILSRLAQLCEADPEREVCGFVVRRRGELASVPIANVADEYHSRSPAEYPRTSRDSYLMDPAALLRFFEELSRNGDEIAAVWHSHVEAGAYFSAKDRADAIVDGRQLVPGAEYLVIGVRERRANEVKRYRYAGGELVESEPS